MGRKNKSESNRLEIQPLGDGLFRLSGYVNGSRIRKQSRNLVELEGEKTKLEHGAQQTLIAQNDRHILPASWITPAQLRDAEAAFLALGNSSLTLVQCVENGLKHLGDGEPVAWGTAYKDYLAWQTEKALSPKTLATTRSIFSRFYQFTKKPANVGDIDNRTIERFVNRPGIMPATRMHDAVQLRTFFNFCVTRKFLRTSPFEMETEHLKKQALRTRARARILTPEQCESLLKAAIARDGGNHVPFLILSLWCFIRAQEVQRLTLSDITFTEKEAFVNIDPATSKTASYRRIPVPANMVALLKECADRGLIDKEPIGKVSNIAWVDIREKAGLLNAVPSKKFQSQKVLTDSQWQANILRHTGVSYRFQQSGDIDATSREAGHSATVAFQHYVNLGQPEAAAKFYAIRATLPAQDHTQAPVLFQASA